MRIEHKDIVEARTILEREVLIFTDRDSFARLVQGSERSPAIKAEIDLVLAAAKLAQAHIRNGRPLTIQDIERFDRIASSVMGNTDGQSGQLTSHILASFLPCWKFGGEFVAAYLKRHMALSLSMRNSGVANDLLPRVGASTTAHEALPNFTLAAAEAYIRQVDGFLGQIARRRHIEVIAYGKKPDQPIQPSDDFRVVIGRPRSAAPAA